MPSPEDYRSLELDEAAKSAVQRSSSVMGNFIKFGVPAASVLFVGWMLYASQHKDARSMTAPDKEEFHTTAFLAPSIDARPNLDLGKMTVPPPPPAAEVPPPPVAPPTALAPPPAPETGNEPTIDDSEARRLAAEEERRRWERLRSPQLVANGAQERLEMTRGGARAQTAPAWKMMATDVSWRRPDWRASSGLWRRRMSGSTRSCHKERRSAANS